MKKKIPDETKEEKFKRIASARSNKILHHIRLLSNCSNKGVYSYTEDQIEHIYSTIEKELKDSKSKFKSDDKKREIHL